VNVGMSSNDKNL